MSSSTYSSLPTQDIEGGHQTNTELGTPSHSNQCHEFFGTPSRFLQTILGFISLLIFFIVIAYNLDQFSNPIPPKIFIHSLKVPTFIISNDGKLSATWNVNLTVSNSIDSSLVDFRQFQAILLYKEGHELALSSPIECENQVVPGTTDWDENKTVSLTFSTEGFERNQPIVDENVLQEIVENRKRGVLRLGMLIMVNMKVKLDVDPLILIMYPYCSDLDVYFAPPAERGETAAFLDGQPRECVGPAEWGFEQTEQR